MSPTQRLRRLVIGGWALSLVLLLVLGTLLLRSLLGGEERLFSLLAEKPPAQPTEREVLLYFASPGAEGLSVERRIIPTNASAVREIRVAIEELIEGPHRALTPTIDANVRLLNVYLLNGVAVLDFSAELQTMQPGGSISELLTIYSLVHTVTDNFTVANAVKLLVEGEEIDTLNGHVDTRYPFRSNPDWVLPEYAS